MQNINFFKNENKSKKQQNNNKADALLNEKWGNTLPNYDEKIINSLLKIDNLKKDYFNELKSYNHYIKKNKKNEMAYIENK